MSSIAHSIMETSAMVSETGADQRKFTLLDRKKSIHSDTLFSEGTRYISSIGGSSICCAAPATAN